MSSRNVKAEMSSKECRIKIVLSRVSSKSVKQEYLIKVSSESVMQEYPARVLNKNVKKE